MKVYKYPVRYFFGSWLSSFGEKQRRISSDLFIKNHPTVTPITGETGIDGLLIDFNRGLRLQIPKGNWHVRIADVESGLIFFDEDVSRTTLVSMEKFYIDWEIAIWLDGEPVFYHLFDPRGQKIHFSFGQQTLGDNITLLPYVEAFRQKFDCDVTCSISPLFHEIVRNYYPTLRLSDELPTDSYACFYLSVFTHMPLASIQDALSIPLRQAGESILRKIKQPPKKIFTPTKPRKIKKPYVCIGVQASTTNKCWLNPDGWERVVDYLKTLGYRVLCIDRDRQCTNHGMTIKQPAGVEDLSGKYTLMDRINQLAYADFFIGVSSGLSWLAWAVDIPVIMISGISEPWYEFETPYRINNSIVCHGCYNWHRSLSKTWSCPLFKGTDREFECSKNISARQVIAVIDRLIADHKLLGGSS